MQLKEATNNTIRLSKLTKAAVLLLPFVFWPFGFENFETPKVVVFLIYSLLAVLLLIAAPSIFKSFISTTSMKLYVLFLLALFLTSLFGYDFVHSLMGSYTRNDGLLFYTGLLIFAYALYTVEAYSSGFTKKLILEAVKVSYVVASLVIIKFTLTKLKIIPTEDLLYDGREVFTFGQPNLLGGYLALMFILHYYHTTGKRKALLAVILLAGLLVTFSKSAFLIVVLFCVYLVIKKLRISAQVVFVGLFALLLGALVIANSYWFKRLHSENKSYQLQRLTIILSPNLLKTDPRVEIFKVSWEASKRRLLLGYGLGNTDAAVYELTKDSKVLRKQGILDSSHNLLLDLLIQGGIFSGVLFLAFVVWNLREAYIKSRLDVFFVLVFFLLWSFTQITPMYLFLLLILLTTNLQFSGQKS